MSPKSSASAGSRVDALSLGVDIGATKVVSALVRPDGSIAHESGRYLHANDGPDGVIGSVLESIRTCLRARPDFRPPAIGLAVAAQVDPGSGKVVHAPNLGWRDVPLAARVAREFRGVRVVVGNDARVATLAEWRLGAGRGSCDLFCLIWGTGLGGSAVVGNRLLAGSTHALGEVGHIPLVSGGRKCHCPNSGCLEAYVGGWAVAERAREAVRADSTAGAPMVRAAGSLDEITARTVVEVARQGDPLAAHLVSETLGYLADGAVGIVNAFNPELLVLGGGLAAGLPECVPTIEGAVRSRCQPPAAAVRVVIGRFGENAPLIGAAELARVGVGAAPSEGLTEGERSSPRPPVPGEAGRSPVAHTPRKSDAPS